ncbi:DUF4179 domain-containing protein [Paenibacillus sp. MER 180]|uniref:DUF4179 domain-containing protein n=1 Tax=Paenibacillus sp. MER 180 TaxID=2939570 RepID=UPI00203FABA5|nr:DUF4179 domain-containing protein [Paenibacillus sp. MER 180]MCM3291050.1 DUF4179 domain-containing protein [Paenibacillus sp. MER 180]
MNDVDIDDKEFEEIRVSEIERKKRTWIKGITAAVIVACISTAALGAAFPAYANNISIIRDIFRIIGTGVYHDYKEFSNEINMSQESQGIAFTINEAIFNGETVSLTYSLDSNQDLGDASIIHGVLDIQDAEGMVVSDKITKIGPKRYVGLIMGAAYHQKKPDTVKLTWNVEGVTIPDSKEMIKGKWDYALELKATKSKVQVYK